jgi:hypothetical protein
MDFDILLTYLPMLVPGFSIIAKPDNLRFTTDLLTIGFRLHGLYVAVYIDHSHGKYPPIS